MPPKKSELIDAPLAMLSSGRLVANITHLGTEKLDPGKALELALRTGRPVFVGVAMTTAESLASLHSLDNAAAEILATTIKL